MRAESEYITGVDSLMGLEQRARDRLPHDIFDFVAAGAGDEQAVEHNREVFDQFRLRPRVLSGATLREESSAIDLFSERFAMPLLVAPMGGQKMVHPDGDLATAAAARSAGIGYVTSSASSYTLEEIANVAGVRWFQLYWQADEDITLDLVHRAEAAGYSAIVLTVDAPVHAERPRDARNDFHRPANVPFANLAPYGQADLGSRPVGQRASSTMIDTGRAALNWDSVRWLGAQCKLPLLLKGVLCYEDAALAVEAGVAGLVISNHGGRQLDRAPATLEVLSEIRQAVGAGYPLVMDGGVRRASDIVIALCLGATAVGIGRPVLWALACGGQHLVESMFMSLAAEFRRQLVQMGVDSVGSLSPRGVRHDSARNEYPSQGGATVGVRN
jgi:4-hydroxymandelate oxidase